MVKFIVTGHGKFADGLVDVINIIMGTQEDIIKIAFTSQDLDMYSNQIEDIVKDSKGGVLIFTDLIGGTPFRISSLVSTRYDNVYVITGANIPMIIEAIVKREGMPLKELVDQITDIGKESIQVFNKHLIAKKNQ